MIVRFAIPLKKKDGICVNSLLKRVEDLKAWMALHFLKFNESKTEVMVFSGTAETPPIEIGYLYKKSAITNLGVKVDADLKFDSQIRAVVKSSFYQLRQLAKIKPILPRKHFETVIHAFITTRLD